MQLNSFLLLILLLAGLAVFVLLCLCFLFMLVFLFVVDLLVVHLIVDPVVMSGVSVCCLILMLPGCFLLYVYCID